MRNFYARLAVLGTVLATMSIGLTAGVANADQTTPPGVPPPQATGWYLALGDSVAAGYQPGQGDDPQGGYVGGVLDALHKTFPKTLLANLACSGETSTTLVQGGHCGYEEGSQLAQALVFLRAHRYTTRLVTLTIGANDVTPCLSTVDITGCVTDRLTTLAANLHLVLSEVHARAPDAQIVVTNYYNPYLALWFASPALAGLTSALQASLNGTISSAAASVGADTADVASAFESTDGTLIDFNGAQAPTNVVRVCQYTWMCLRGDIHPNDAGYVLIATAVIGKL